MNIVYLIGNGFDKNLGMQTDYQDFYNHYLKLSSDNDTDVVKTFKQELEKERYKKYDKWSDLELAIGNYLEYLSAEEAVELHGHLVDNLSKYIKLEEDKWPFDKDQKSVFHGYLMNPHSRLFPTDISEINQYRSQWNNSGWHIRIITFNYSMSVERLINNQKGKISSHGTYDINLSEIEHIHGFTDDRLIFGVNDDSQIANEKLRGEGRVTNRYVKSDCNSSYRSAHDAKCRQWLSKANLICTFGLSFGDTDKKWWELVGETLKGDCKMILFEYNKNKNFNGNQGPDRMEEEEAIKDRFLQKTNIEESLREKIKKNIYVAYNTDMFKLNIGKQDERKA